MSHTPRSAPNEPYIVFADQRRLRWLWQAAVRRTAYLVIGAITLGAGAYIVHRVRPDTLNTAAEFEALLGLAPKDTIALVTQVTATKPLTRPSSTNTSSTTTRSAAVPSVSRSASQKPATSPQQSTAPREQPTTRQVSPPATKSAPSVTPKEQARPPANTNSAPVVATSAAPGWLVVSSRPWGNLYVDGRSVGNTPQATVWLTPGTHKIEIRREGFKTFLANVSIDSNREFRLTRVTLDPATQ